MRQARMLLQGLADRVHTQKLTDEERELLAVMLGRMADGVPAEKAAIDKPVALARTGRPRLTALDRRATGLKYADRYMALRPEYNSESAALVAVGKEFGVNRTTVLRSLEWLQRQTGWREIFAGELCKN